MFTTIVEAEMLSKVMASKAAESGLALGYVRLAFERGGKGGISNLFKENVEGHARVTATKKSLSMLFLP